MNETTTAFAGTYEEYQAYVAVFLACVEQVETYDEEVVLAAWEAGEDGIAAAMDCYVVLE